MTLQADATVTVMTLQADAIVIRRDPALVAASEARVLQRAKRDAIAEVNNIVGDVRSRYITTAPGQEMIYLSKEAEARDCLADTGPVPSSYPLLAAEVGITAETLAQVAQVILNIAGIWRGIAAELETLRFHAIAAIEDAPDPQAVADVVTSLRHALDEGRTDSS